jgi:hypothetical protein
MADEERLELSTNALTGHRSAIELFIRNRVNAGQRLIVLCSTTEPLNELHSKWTRTIVAESRSNTDYDTCFVAATGLEPVSRAYETHELTFTPNRNFVGPGGIEPLTLNV